MKGEVFMHVCYMLALCQLHKWKHEFLPGKLGGEGVIPYMFLLKEVSPADREPATQRALHTFGNDLGEEAYVSEASAFLGNISITSNPELKYYFPSVVL